MMAVWINCIIVFRFNHELYGGPVAMLDDMWNLRRSISLLGFAVPAAYN